MPCEKKILFGLWNRAQTCKYQMVYANHELKLPGQTWNTS